VSEPSELFRLPLRPLLKLTLFSRVLISTPPSPVLVSKSSARTFSDQLPPQSTVSSLTQRLTNPRFTKSFSLVDPPVFLASRSSLPTTSMARSPTSPLTLMRLLHTVLPSRLPFSLVTPHLSPPLRSSFSMLRHCPLVLRLLVVK
jgi:hypothetical protein